MAGEDKTEKATPKKRRDQRKEGNVLQSKEIVTAFSVAGIFAGAALLAKLILQQCISITGEIFAEIGTVTEVNTEFVIQLYVRVLTVLVITILPLSLIAMLVGSLPTVAQTRGLFTMKALRPKFSRLNPLEGFKRLFSIQSAVGMIKSLIEVIIICYVVYSQIVGRIPQIIALMNTDVIVGLSYFGTTIFELVMIICVLLVFVAAADFLFQWWQFEKKLKMSKQEVKDEYKQMEGDPQIKGKIKQMQQQMAQKRMMAEVPTSDVVIRNPTHYAIAIKYDQDKNRAPIVVAKGVDALALRIVKIAQENDIYMTENPPLAHLLYNTVKIGMEIPPDLYHTIAEILAVVYEIKNKKLH